ncbi:SMODS domain-containing nucleotidyltransferase [Pseudonocardia bannensis]|uniref:Nucleotidyltransferase n=1 Tax=Pseudonocardia bannensis TaxID=630973 RepID=A0A848DFD4_9PSEU|nr:nucleotidyltransferase [Pseudonocardia bannensis]NMH91275.1 nucleotidyltransferase [Pseudonocardia bannensis]
MAQSALSYLNELLAFYTPSSTYFDSARQHRSAIEKRLDLKLGVREMFETGSLRHGTGVAYWSDADYLVSLKGERPTSTTALNNVKAELADRFKSTVVKIRRPAVVCDFADGKETVEVVPAFAADSGYWIPDPTGGWMKTHPKDHNSYVNDVNKKHAGGAKKLARLAKVWKYRRRVPVSSCYLEMRAAKYADGETSWHLPIELHRYLARLQDIQLAAMNDPTGLGSRFTAYSSDSKRDDALSKLATAVTRARRAKEFDLDGESAKAIEQYKLLFDK